MKIFKSKRTVSVWGSSQPKQLLEIANHLNASGFEGPTQASTLYSLYFVRKIDSDLKLTCSIDRVYEEPHGVFNFQTYLVLSSFALYADADDARLWGPSIGEVNEKSVGVFSVGLQHLKWNAEGGDDNPVWQVSALPQYENSANDWIADWERYGAPIVSAITDISSAIVFCQQALKYQKNPWVKSDGFGSYAFDIFTAMLMVRNHQVEEAKAFLINALNINDREAKRAQLREAKKMQLQLALDWVETKMPPSLH